jgi:hypothetical protein
MQEDVRIKTTEEVNKKLSENKNRTAPYSLQKKMKLKRNVML